MGADDILDVLLLIFVIAILSPIMITNAIPMIKGDVGGFDTLIDKTARKTTAEIKPKQRILTKEDVLLMAVIADKKMPRPATVRIAAGSGESGDIVLEDFLNRQQQVLNTINSYVPVDKGLEIKTQVGSIGIKKWMVVARE